ncbi:hypothetical protein [Hazenella coriacea]|uniref:Uncharacterized protein n=1 Tax=Hazenella coriacea TaxID=1179467 RepID=A0A4V2UVF9_9BACL|nr:hypothetical protein [Hazenella coriacea]TCS95657.1 hypothetical protein EDD58_102232 [Hazenella coriacea]
MDLLLENPIVWIGIAILLVILIIVISVLVGKKRAREVEELDQMFTEGHLAGEDFGKISVEKVRRNALEREKRKKELQHLHPVKERPKKGVKVIPDEDKEIILTPILSDSRPNPTIKRDTESAMVKDEKKKQVSSARSHLKKDMVQEESVSSKSRLSPTSSQVQPEELDPNQDPPTSRHLYKKSLLSPERGEEEGEGEMPSNQPQLTERELKSPSKAQESAMGNSATESGIPSRMGGLPNRTGRGYGGHSSSTQTRPRELPSRSKRRPPSKNMHDR